jgi:hypothetical protein
VSSPPCHGRAWPGHPRIFCVFRRKVMGDPAKPGHDTRGTPNRGMSCAATPSACTEPANAAAAPCPNPPPFPLSTPCSPDLDNNAGNANRTEVARSRKPEAECPASFAQPPAAPATPMRRRVRTHEPPRRPHHAALRQPRNESSAPTDQRHQSTATLIPNAPPSRLAFPPVRLTARTVRPPRPSGEKPPAKRDCLAKPPDGSVSPRYTAPLRCCVRTCRPRQQRCLCCTNDIVGRF